MALFVRAGNSGTGEERDRAVGRRFEAIVDGVTISRHKDRDTAVMAILDHLQKIIDTTPVGTEVEAWVAHGDDVVVTCNGRLVGKGVEYLIERDPA